MDINIRRNDDQEQLICMSSLSTGKNSNQDIICQTNNNNNENELIIENNQQTSIQRLFLSFTKFFKSIHLPHLSDRLLRIIFLLFITLIGITGFTIALIVGSSIVKFKQQCPLYASFEYAIFQTIQSNWTIKIVPLTEKFSSQSTCDFCTFYNVFTFIYCVITGFFFILFNGDAKVVTTNDQCLIIPWFPISTILGFFSLINASILTNGFLKFCSTIISNNHQVASCTQLNNFFFEQYPTVSSLFIYMLIAIVASWIQLIFFIGIITILTIRLGSSIDLSNNNNNNNINNNRIDDKSINIVIQSTEQT